MIFVGRCPKCSSETDSGVGLAYGGYGTYQFCANMECDWYEKERECPICESVSECECEE